jgi:DNA-binding transcriptional MerR regulator
MPSAAHGFPSHVAAPLAGVTLRTLINWSARGFLLPSVSRGGRGTGNQSVYSFQDLVAIRVVDELRAQGIDVRHLRGVVAHIRKRDDVALDREIPASRLLISDGHFFMQLDDNVRVRDAVLRLPAQPPKALLLVPLGAIVNKLQADARTLGLRAA